MNGFPQAGSGQIVGLREEQQDALGFGTISLADGRRAPLAILADGMGGHHGGAIAARLAIDTFLDACRASPAKTFTGALETALLDANRALAARAREDARLDQMGCTLIATAIEGGMLHYISVGDSLLWRVGEARIERINADHSMMPVVTAAVAQGKMTLEEAQAHGSMLRSALTGRPIDLVDLRSIELAHDECALLASDGILTLGESEVHALAGPVGRAAQARVDALLDAVEYAGEPDQDNCTVLLLPMTGVPAKSARRSMATLLGTLAIIAGLCVFGVAVWELIRIETAAKGGATARTTRLALPPPGVTAPITPTMFPTTNSAIESIIPHAVIQPPKIDSRKKSDRPKQPGLQSKANEVLSTRTKATNTGLSNAGSAKSGAILPTRGDDPATNQSSDGIQH